VCCSAYHWQDEEKKESSDDETLSSDEEEKEEAAGMFAEDENRGEGATNDVSHAPPESACYFPGFFQGEPFCALRTCCVSGRPKVVQIGVARPRFVVPSWRSALKTMLSLKKKMRETS
jgi:hypothetical protein